MTLPRRPMIDTGFFILANRERPNDPRTEEHAAALRALEESRADILIAAPSIAELLRKKYKEPPPATRWIVLSFGRLAAELLGARLPKRFVTSKEHPGGYWKYDAMIAACAVVAKADAILVADVDYTNILKELEPDGTVRILSAQDITGRQTSFRYARPMRQSTPIPDDPSDREDATPATSEAAPGATQQPLPEPPTATGAASALATPPQEQAAPTALPVTPAASTTEPPPEQAAKPTTDTDHPAAVLADQTAAQAQPGEPPEEPEQAATPTPADAVTEAVPPPAALPGLLADLTPLSPDEPVG